MNKETIKSIILTALIIISLLLTWNTWTYQPVSKQKQDRLYESTPITDEERKLSEVIKPQQLFIHQGEEHYSTIDTSYLNSMWKEMLDWEYSNLKKRHQSFNSGNFQKWLNERKDYLELRFYSEIPMETFQSMLRWEADVIKDLSFDRIFLEMEKESDIQKVYFVSYDKMKVVESSINNDKARLYVDKLFAEKDEFLKYFSFQITGGKEIFLPENEITMENFRYFTEQIPGTSFRDALFSNPSIVKQDIKSSINSYTDSTRLLNIYPNSQWVEYVNTTLGNTNTISASELVVQSVKFLNDHGGWTNDYGLFDINEDEQETKFIMHIQSIPVINSTDNQFGPTTITQVWGQNEIAQYVRPLYKIDERLPNNSSTLMSGKMVEEKIKKNTEIINTDIDNIYIAYELSSLGNQKVVNVAPVWVVEMNNGDLLKMNEDTKKSGGNENGVE